MSASSRSTSSCPRPRRRPTCTRAIDEFNDDPGVDAFIVQLPLPKGLDDQAALDAIDPTKDADGLHPVNLGRLMLGARRPAAVHAARHPGAARAQRRADRRSARRHRRSRAHDRPAARGAALAQGSARERDGHALPHRHRTSCPSTREQADILIAAAGSPSIIRPDMVKPGAAVVGAGITMEGRRVVPDVDEACADVAGWITPRLGGVGPTTRAMLLRNTVDAAERRAGAARRDRPRTDRPSRAARRARAPVAADDAALSELRSAAPDPSARAGRALGGRARARACLGARRSLIVAGAR